MKQPIQQSGFVLIGLLVALTLAAIAAVQTGQRLADSRRQAMEVELLFVGEQYRSAILSYWGGSPGVRSWPTRLDELLEDRRFPLPRRHLRKLYDDPLDPGQNLALINQGSAIVGVYSQAAGLPFRQTGFTPKQRGFDAAQRYSDWRFIAEAPVSLPPPTAASSPTAPVKGIPAPITTPIQTPRGAVR